MTRYVWIPVLAMSLSLGCSDESGDDDTLDRLRGKTGAEGTKASCSSDDDCYRGKFICVDGTCTKGKRSPEELAKRAQAKAEAERAEWLASQKVKPGEGRLKVMLCDVFERSSKQTGGMLTARNAKTGQVVAQLPLHDDRRIPVGQQIQFVTFPSLPLGTYHVDLKIGTHKRGTNENDFQAMMCHAEGRPCLGGTVREMTVVLPEEESRRDSQLKGLEKKPKKKKIRLSKEGIEEQKKFDEEFAKSGKIEKTSRCDFDIQ